MSCTLHLLAFYSILRSSSHSHPAASNVIIVPEWRFCWHLLFSLEGKMERVAMRFFHHRFHGLKRISRIKWAWSIKSQAHPTSVYHAIHNLFFIRAIRGLHFPIQVYGFTRGDIADGWLWSYGEIHGHKDHAERRGKHLLLDKSPSKIHVNSKLSLSMNPCIETAARTNKELHFTSNDF